MCIHSSFPSNCFSLSLRSFSCCLNYLSALASSGTFLTQTHQSRIEQVYFCWRLSDLRTIILELSPSWAVQQLFKTSIEKCRLRSAKDQSVLNKIWRTLRVFLLMTLCSPLAVHPRLSLLSRNEHFKRLNHTPMVYFFTKSLYPVTE